MWDFTYGYCRWGTRVAVYYGLLRDEYPPCGESDYPMYLDVAYPERSSRLLLFGRFFLTIPLGLWMRVLTILLSAQTLASFFTILFTANIPEGMRSMIVGIYGYCTRVGVYQVLLTDTWPGFSIQR